MNDLDPSLAIYLGYLIFTSCWRSHSLGGKKLPSTSMDGWIHGIDRESLLRIRGEDHPTTVSTWLITMVSRSPELSKWPNWFENWGLLTGMILQVFQPLPMISCWVLPVRLWLSWMSLLHLLLHRPLHVVPSGQVCCGGTGGEKNWLLIAMFALPR